MNLGYFLRYFLKYFWLRKQTKCEKTQFYCKKTDMIHHKYLRLKTKVKSLPCFNLLLLSTKYVCCIMFFIDLFMPFGLCSPAHFVNASCFKFQLIAYLGNNMFSFTFFNNTFAVYCVLYGPSFYAIWT